MRLPLVAITVAILFCACDERRVYEKNFDFDSRFWRIHQQPEFEFEIQDSTAQYNLYCNLRNSVAYPYSRLFVNYYLRDSTGGLLRKGLLEMYLFDQKSGKPFGQSGIGDIYDQRVPVLTAFQFPYAGNYSIGFQQYMRLDTLDGILAVGLRVEKDLP